MAECIDSGGKILSCGNGGSQCDAMHFSEELTGKFRQERKALPAIAISDISHVTCVGNDYGFNHIFSISEGIDSLEYSITNAERLLINTSERIISSIAIDL